MYEVEQKYRVIDVADLEARLNGLGAVWHGTAKQVDRYFGHPSRDFAATDEALRLRSTPDGVVITWKGPRLDATAKTRREIELPLAEAAVPAAAGAEAAVSVVAGAEAAVSVVAGAEAAVPVVAGAEATDPVVAGASSAGPVAATLRCWTELLEALGFRQVREVVKRRRIATVVCDGAAIEAALDHVVELGDFVELEIQADAAGITVAAARVEALARKLGCTDPERRSYLELLLGSAERKG